MPAWVVDGGRYFGSLLVFALCAACSGLALVPCVQLFLLIAARTSMPWAIFSVPFLYGLWGTLFCLLCIAFKRALFYRPREGEWPLFSPSVIGWALTGPLANWANVFFLQHLKGTPFLNLYLRAMGVTIGKRVSINTIHIYDWDLVHIGDDAILGGDCVVQGHIVEGGKMKMKPVRIGNRVLIGTGAKVMPGCVVEDRGVLAAGSIMKKSSTVPENAIFGGTPAKLIRLRDDKDVDDDGGRAKP